MSHFDHCEVPEAYNAYIRRKVLFLTGMVLLTSVLLILSVSLGAVRVPSLEVVKTFLNLDPDPRFAIIVHRIRLPHALAALVAGAGLSVAGAAMQSVLRNPLGSPFTLGISQAGAFGAAFSVMLLGAGTMQSAQADAISLINPYLTTLCAFVACMITSLIIVAIARLRGASPEVLVLSGVALGALFSAGTMFLQYFADDVQLAAMVFWTFGDVGRAGWTEVWFMAVVVAGATGFFMVNRWRYNAIDAGDTTARSLGVRVERVRVAGMMIASVVTAVIVSFLGIIGFVGLVCPHIVRRVIGDDHRFLLPASVLTGASLLLAADIAARLMLAPRILPVAILTAFLGAPTFLYLLIARRHR